MLDELSNVIENNSSFLSEEDQTETKNEYTFFKEAVEQILLQFNDYIIALANDDLKYNQKVIVNESNEMLVAGLDFNDGIEGFAWNDAKKGEMVGVFPFSLKFVQELINLYKEFERKTHNNLPIPSTLTSLEENTLKTIISEKGIFQNQLWKQLNIDSRKCSRIVKSLLDKNLIKREEAVSNGARTYLLKSNVR